MSVNSGRAFRPRSAPLALSRFSLLEDDDEDADDEISDNDPSPNNNNITSRHRSQPSHNQAQSIGNLREHSPPPPVVFIPRDRRRNTGRNNLFLNVFCANCVFTDGRWYCLVII